MELGEKLRQARQEAGLSQRQLCGDIITRNMLSQIEHGTARPSMDTLRCLAARLEKPLSYFLDENAAVSPNQDLMVQARGAFASGHWTQARQLLQSFRLPDPVLDWEWKYRSFMTALEAARTAMEEGKLLYAGQLLEEAAEIDHGIPGLERQRLLLLGRLPGADLTMIAKQLPSLDEELLLRAEAALSEKEPEKASGFLAAAEDRENPRWNLLRGKAMVLQKQYAKAVQYLKKAEDVYPAVCLPLLETCFREQGDFQQAYEYACKQR